MMRVFIFMNEVGAGEMRRAKEGETLDQYVDETLLDEVLMESMTYGRLIPDDEYEPEPVRPYSISVDELDWEFHGESGTPPRFISGFADDEYILSWFEAEVPDWTRFEYNGGCHRDLNGYCGMGGAGYVELMEEV
jgi:hypothetical protein